MSVFRPARLLAACIATACVLSAPAQNWIAPTTAVGFPYAAWEDSANWSPGVVPNSPTATATFNMHSSPNGQMSALISSDIAVGAIDFLPNRILNTFYYPTTRIGSTRTFAVALGHLVISGSGFHPGGAETNGASFLHVVNGSLEFRNQAEARTNLVMSNDGSVWGQRKLVFAGQSSLRGNIATDGRGSSAIEFRDQSVLRSGRLDVRFDTTVTFRDQASVVDGSIAPTEPFALSARINVLGSPTLAGLDVSSPYGGLHLDISGAAGPVTLRSLSGWVDVELGANTLRLTRLPTGSGFRLDGRINGAGGLALSSVGPANYHLTNPDNRYAGPTQISGAGLTVHLMGGGRLNNVTLDDRATLRVSGGSNAIGGDFTIADGTLRLPGFTTARLVVQGKASLAGTFVLEEGLEPAAAIIGTRRFVVLTAGEIVGRFSTLSGLRDTAMLRSRLDYGTQDVGVIVEQLPFAGVEEATPGARQFGAYLDTHTTAPPPALINLLHTLNRQQTRPEVAASLAGLSPDRYAVLSALGLGVAGGRQTALFARLHDAAAGPGGVTAFFEAGSRRGRHDARDHSPAARDRADTGLAGVLWRRHRATLGLFAGTDRSRTDLDPAGSRARSDESAVGLLGSLQTGAGFLRAVLSTGRTAHELSRRVTGAINETALASPESRRTDAALEAGRAFAARGFRLTPAIGLMWSRWRMDDFAETGAPVSALAVSGWSRRSVRSRLGFELAPQSPGRFTPRLALHWLHEFADTDGFTARLTADPGEGYPVSGRAPERNVLAGSLSFETPLGRNGLAWLRLGGAHGGHSRTTSELSAGVRWRF